MLCAGLDSPQTSREQPLGVHHRFQKSYLQKAVLSTLQRLHGGPGDSWGRASGFRILYRFESASVTRKFTLGMVRRAREFVRLDKKFLRPEFNEGLREDNPGVRPGQSACSYPLPSPSA